MPTPLRRLSLLAGVVLLLAGALVATVAVPASHAQSAGDEQYGDPFGSSSGGGTAGGDDRGGKTSGGDRSSASRGSSGSSGRSRGSTSGGAGGGATGGSGSSGSSSGTSSGQGVRATAPLASPQPANGQLAHTGLDLRVPAIVGAVLLAAGLLLLRRPRPARRR